MQIIADLQVHSRFARACSKQITLPKLEQYAKIKGLHLLGTGDFQHPIWYREITSYLKEDENGILWSPSNFPFLWQSEVSLMYSQGGKGRSVHHLIFAPNGEVVKQLIDVFSKRWRLDYDGRPIFGISSIEFIELLQSVSKDIELVPAHAWTSWMAIFGSKSGFNSVEECFKEKSHLIHAIETGISSNPLMNYRISSLDKYNLVSFSDLHSFYPWRIGREATIFDIKELSYKNILNAIRTGEGLSSTIETNPEYGKYHIDGHRLCNVVFEPSESRKLNNICPKCHKELTIGVLNRVEELADRPQGYIRKNARPFHHLIPLTELIAAVYSIKQLASKKVWEVYNVLIKNFNNEFNIMLNIPEEALKKVIEERLVKVIIKCRQDQLKIKPGYDGVYGEILLEDNERMPKLQKSLTDF